MRIDDEVEEHRRGHDKSYDRQVQVGASPHNLGHVRLQFYLVPDRIDDWAKKIKQRFLRNKPKHKGARSEGQYEPKLSERMRDKTQKCRRCPTSAGLIHPSEWEQARSGTTKIPSCRRQSPTPPTVTSSPRLKIVYSTGYSISI